MAGSFRVTLMAHSNLLTRSTERSLPKSSLRQFMPSIKKMFGQYVLVFFVSLLVGVLARGLFYYYSGEKQMNLFDVALYYLPLFFSLILTYWAAFLTLAVKNVTLRGLLFWGIIIVIPVFRIFDVFLLGVVFLPQAGAVAILKGWVGEP